MVQRQLDIGVDCIGDGEFWKARNFAYYSRHLTGLDTRAAAGRARPARPAPARASATSSPVLPGHRRDRDDLRRARAKSRCRPSAWRMIATGPVKSKGTAALAQEIELQGGDREGRTAGRRGVLLRDRAGLARSLHLQRVLQGRGGVTSSRSPRRCARNTSRWSNAGFILQVDDPGVVDWWDMLKPR